MVCVGTFYVCFSVHWGSASGFWLLQYSSGIVWQSRYLQVSQHVVSVEYSSLLYIGFIISYLFFYLWFILDRNDSGWVRNPPHGPTKYMEAEGEGWGSVKLA